MGASASVEQTQPQKDISYLGDRMPFGDAELWQVYRVYQRLQDAFGEKRQTSFLTDAGVLAAAEGRRMDTRRNASQEADREQEQAANAFLEQRKRALETVQDQILPAGVGNTLFRICFQRSTDAAFEYNESPAFSSSSPNDDCDRVGRLEAFFEGLSNGTRRDRKTVTRCLIRCCTQYPLEEDEAGEDNFPENDFAYGGATTTKPKTMCIDPMELVDLGYRICLAAAYLKEVSASDETDRFVPPEDLGPGLKALSNSLVALATKRKQRRIRSTVPTTELLSRVKEDDVLEWVEQVAPMYGSILPTFLHAVFFPNRPAPPTRSSFDYPSLLQESTIFVRPSSPLLFSFGCMSPSLGGEYYRLYTSASDGLSFNRLQNALLGYGGPTLLVIQSGRSTFGAFTSSPWKESKDFYGNHDCFLFRLLPDTTAVYRPTGGTSKASSRFMYCNSFARSRGFDRQAHGIGFGGSTDRPRLFLSESFDDCCAGSDDLTFDKGPLLAGTNGTNNTTHFDIDNLEVWGVGGTLVVEQSLAARTASRDIRQAAINKARKVDKAAFLDDLRSGVIENKAFAHREQIQGRDGTVELIDDR